MTSDRKENAHRSGNCDGRESEMTGNILLYIGDTSNTHYSSEKLDHAKKTLNRFMRWRESNMGAYTYAERHALLLHNRGERIGAQALIELIRNKDFWDADGRPTTINNGFSPILARVLISEHPELQESIELRRCIYDVILGGAASDIDVRHRGI